MPALPAILTGLVPAETIACEAYLLQRLRFAARVGQGTAGAGLPAILTDLVPSETIACEADSYSGFGSPPNLGRAL